MFNSSLMRSALVMLTALGVVGAASAQESGYPQKPIKLVVPSSAGSGQDLLARRLAERLSKVLGQTMIVDNQPGAGGVIGAEALIRAPADGYTLSLVTSNYTIFPHIYTKVKFDAMNDITAIAGVAMSPMVLITRANFPASNVADLVAMAKKDPNRITMGSSGSGTILHLVGMQMQKMAGIELLHVPYKGAAPVVPEVASGSVDIAFSAYSPVKGLVDTGKLKILAVTSEKRYAQLPNVPTVGETIKGFSRSAWYAVIGPKGLPAAIVNRLHTAINQVIQTKDFEERIAQDSVSPMPMAPATLKTFMEADFATQGELVKAAGVKLD